MHEYLNIKIVLLLVKRGAPLVIYLTSMLLFSCQPGTRENSGVYVQDADYLQVVLFHLAQRCESCNAVEEETLLLLETEYEAELRAGKVKFVSLDFQTEQGKRAAEILHASGQTLFVVWGDSLDNLTGPAFMYASTHPEYYREALRKSLDQALE
jgi:hypothetical protein